MTGLIRHALLGSPEATRGARKILSLFVLGVLGGVSSVGAGAKRPSRPAAYPDGDPMGFEVRWWS